MPPSPTLPDIALQHPLLLGLLGLLLLPVIVYASFFRKMGSLAGAPPRDPEGIPGLGPLRFWTDRMGYMRDAGRRSETGNYSFDVGPWAVVGLSGPSGRAAYYNSHKNLELEPGMNALIISASASPPDPKDENVSKKKNWNLFGKARLLEMIRPEKLKAALPLFCDDSATAYNKLGDRGTLDPMTDMYFLAWKMSMRLLGPAEVIESPELLQKTFRLSISLDALLGGIDVLLPWLPTLGRTKRMFAGLRLFLIMNSIIKQRRKANAQGKGRKNDAFQMMFDHGDFDSTILKQALNMLFVAQINTALNTSSTICNLGAYPAWQKRVYDELVEVAARYATNTNAPLSEQLKDIPVEVWDSGLPVLYACLKETVRMQVVGTFLRQNTTSEPIPLHSVDKEGVSSRQEVVPPGAMIAYNAVDTAANPDIYPDPDSWNPGRYLPGDEAYSKQRGRDVPYADATWGSGKHICTGQKLAKLEAHVIVGFFVAMFEWDLTDDNGKVLTKGVPAQWDAWMPSRPKDQYRVRYTKRSGERSS